MNKLRISNFCNFNTNRYPYRHYITTEFPSISSRQNVCCAIKYKAVNGMNSVCFPVAAWNKQYKLQGVHLYLVINGQKKVGSRIVRLTSRSPPLRGAKLCCPLSNLFKLFTILFYCFEWLLIEWKNCGHRSMTHCYTGNDPKPLANIANEKKRNSSIKKALSANYYIQIIPHTVHVGLFCYYTFKWIFLWRHSNYNVANKEL